MGDSFRTSRWHNTIILINDVIAIIISAIIFSQILDYVCCVSFRLQWNKLYEHMRIVSTTDLSGFIVMVLILLS